MSFNSIYLCVSNRSLSFFVYVILDMKTLHDTDRSNFGRAFPVITEEGILRVGSSLNQCALMCGRPCVFRGRRRKRLHRTVTMLRECLRTLSGAVRKSFRCVGNV